MRFKRLRRGSRRIKDLGDKVIISREYYDRLNLEPSKSCLSQEGSRLSRDTTHVISLVEVGEEYTYGIFSNDVVCFSTSHDFNDQRYKFSK